MCRVALKLPFVVHPDFLLSSYSVCRWLLTWLEGTTLTSSWMSPSQLSHAQVSAPFPWQIAGSDLTKSFFQGHCLISRALLPRFCLLTGTQCMLRAVYLASTYSMLTFTEQEYKLLPRPNTCVPLLQLQVSGRCLYMISCMLHGTRFVLEDLQLYAKIAFKLQLLMLSM